MAINIAKAGANNWKLGHRPMPHGMRGTQEAAPACSDLVEETADAPTSCDIPNTQDAQQAVCLPPYFTRIPWCLFQSYPTSQVSKRHLDAVFAVQSAPPSGADASAR